MVKAGDWRQKSPTNWCCLMHSFGIFQLISAGSCVSVLLKGRGGLNTSGKALALPQTFVKTGLCGMRKAESVLEHLAWRLAVGTTSAWVSSFLKNSAQLQRKTPGSVPSRTHRCCWEPEGCLWERSEIESHLSLLCLHRGWFYCTPSFSILPSASTCRDIWLFLTFWISL